MLYNCLPRKAKRIDCKNITTNRKQVIIRLNQKRLKNSISNNQLENVRGKNSIHDGNKIYKISKNKPRREWARFSPKDIKDPNTEIKQAPYVKRFYHGIMSDLPKCQFPTNSV